MNQSSTSAGTLAQSAPASGRGYQLSDDLARLCLPSEYKDACRTLAWVNSICFLFLVVGLVGLKSPKIIVRPLSEIAEPLPIELPAPVDQPPVQTEVPPEETPPDTPVEAPQVATIVAAADPASVAFAVPVVGAVAVKEARFATPPPPGGNMVLQPTRFNPNAGSGGSFPEIQYPPFAQRNKYQGTTTLIFTVDANGKVTSVKLQKSSNYPVLDNAAFDALTNRWRFPAGSPGYFIKDFEFRLN